jgi:hypothetical protein
MDAAVRRIGPGAGMTNFLKGRRLGGRDDD